MASETEEGLEFEQLVPLSAGLVPYVISWPSEERPDAYLDAVFLVVLKQATGLIGALPLGVIPDAELAVAAASTDPHSLMGASTTIMVPGVHQDVNGMWELAGTEVGVLVADFSGQVAAMSRVMNEGDPEVFAFVSDRPSIFPRGQEVISTVMDWLSSQGLSNPGGPYTSDSMDEVTAQSEGTPKAKAKSRAQPAGQDMPTTGGGSMPKAPKSKRPTTASLAESLDQVLSILPAMSTQLQAAADR